MCISTTGWLASSYISKNSSFFFVYECVSFSLPLLTTWKIVGNFAFSVISFFFFSFYICVLITSVSPFTHINIYHTPYTYLVWLKRPTCSPISYWIFIFAFGQQFSLLVYSYRLSHVSHQPITNRRLHTPKPDNDNDVCMYENFFLFSVKMGIHLMAQIAHINILSMTTLLSFLIDSSFSNKISCLLVLFFSLFFSFVLLFSFSFFFFHFISIYHQLPIIMYLFSCCKRIGNQFVNMFAYPLEQKQMQTAQKY